MRATLKQDWRRWKKGKTLTGAAAREALAEKVASKTKPQTEAPAPVNTEEGS